MKTRYFGRALCNLDTSEKTVRINTSRTKYYVSCGQHLSVLANENMNKHVIKTLS